MAPGGIGGDQRDADAVEADAGDPALRAEPRADAARGPRRRSRAWRGCIVRRPGKRVSTSPPGTCGSPRKFAALAKRAAHVASRLSQPSRSSTRTPGAAGRRERLDQHQDRRRRPPRSARRGRRSAPSGSAGGRRRSDRRRHATTHRDRASIPRRRRATTVAVRDRRGSGGRRARRGTSASRSRRRVASNAAVGPRTVATKPPPLPVRSRVTVPSVPRATGSVPASGAAQSIMNTSSRAPSKRPAARSASVIAPPPRPPANSIVATSRPSPALIADGVIPGDAS